MQRGKCTVCSNPWSGAVYIDTDPGYGYIQISQKYREMQWGKMIVSTRIAIVPGRVENLIYMAPGDELPGNIYIKESTTPVDYSNPESYLLWKDTNTVERTDKGEPIWQYTMYSVDVEEQDTIVPRTAVMTNS